MIDISDGLLIDLQHILKESKVGARIWEEKIPLSKSYKKWINFYSKDDYNFALRGGEDYELLFTAPPHSKKEILNLSKSEKILITWIGKILPLKEGFYIIDKNGLEYSPSLLGFEHFK